MLDDSLLFGMSLSKPLCFASVVRGVPASRGLPGGNSLFFCVAKRKVSKRKGDPMVWVPALRFGQPVVLDKSGFSLELGFASDSREP